MDRERVGQQMRPKCRMSCLKPNARPAGSTASSCGIHARSEVTSKSEIGCNSGHIPALPRPISHPFSESDATSDTFRPPRVRSHHHFPLGMRLRTHSGPPASDFAPLFRIGCDSRHDPPIVSPISHPVPKLDAISDTICPPCVRSHSEVTTGCPCAWPRPRTSRSRMRS